MLRLPAGRVVAQCPGQRTVSCKAGKQAKPEMTGHRSSLDQKVMRNYWRHLTLERMMSFNKTTLVATWQMVCRG